MNFREFLPIFFHKPPRKHSAHDVTRHRHEKLRCVLNVKINENQTFNNEQFNSRIVVELVIQSLLNFGSIPELTLHRCIMKGYALLFSLELVSLYGSTLSSTAVQKSSACSPFYANIANECTGPISLLLGCRNE